MLLTANNAYTIDKNSHKMNIWDALAGRRAVRSYTSEVVSKKVIGFLLDQATLAPSATNLQPWAFVVIQDQKLLKKISDAAKLRLRDDPRWKNAPNHGALNLADEKFDIFYGASTLIVICGRIDSSWSVGDCGMAGENLMLAAHGLGLATCPIGLARDVLQADHIKAELRIAKDYQAVLPIIIGFPKDRSPKVSRAPANVLSWIEST